MEIITTTKYMARDGKVFLAEEQCMLYENELIAKDKAERIKKSLEEIRIEDAEGMIPYTEYANSDCFDYVWYKATTQTHLDLLNEYTESELSELGIYCVEEQDYGTCWIYSLVDMVNEINVLFKALGNSYTIIKN